MYLILDIETIPLPIPAEAIAEKRKELSEEYAKEETIEKHLAAWKERFKFKPEGAQPVAIGLQQTDGFGEDGELIGLQSGDEKEIAEFFLENCDTRKHTLVGYNIQTFDLPILLRAIFKTKRRLVNRVGKWDVVDLMQQPFGPRFDHTGGFKRLCRAYDVTLSGIDGSMVEEMYKKDLENGTGKVLEYCLDDVRGCTELFNKFARFFAF